MSTHVHAINQQPHQVQRVERRRPPRIQLRLSLRDNASTDRTLARAPRGDVGAERFQTPRILAGRHTDQHLVDHAPVQRVRIRECPGRWQRNLLAGAPRTGPTNRHLPPAQHDLTRRMPRSRRLARRLMRIPWPTDGGPILVQHGFEYLQARRDDQLLELGLRINEDIDQRQVPWRRGYRLATARDCARLLLHGGSLLGGLHLGFVTGRIARPVKSCLGAQLAISVNNCPPPRDPRSRMTSFKRTQRKYVQKAYRVRNWREYETGLRARGSLTVWLGLTDGTLANWHSPRPTRRKPGRQRQYSNHAIETTVTVGLVFGLASRQPEGFLRSLLTLLNLDNDVPDHSTISRRKARLGQVASYERRTVKPVHLRIDSSGLSVHVGQLRTPPQARDYRKLHLAVDEHTSDVVACELTSKRARDASRVASLVGQIERPIASAKADAAYDTGDV